MAKKRKRSNVAIGTPKSSPPWSAEETNILYGWLDYCVNTVGYSKEDYLSTVCVKLEDKGSIRHDISKVSSKLRRDWRRYGTLGCDFEDIFKHDAKGASLMFGFSAQEKEQIARAAQQFIHESRTPTATPARILRDRTSNQFRSMSRTPGQSLQDRSPSLVKREKKNHDSPALRTYGNDRRRNIFQAPRALEIIIKEGKKSVNATSPRKNLRSEFDPPERSSKREFKPRDHSHTISVVEDSEGIEDESNVSALPSSSDGRGATVDVKQDGLDEPISNISRKLSPAFGRQKRCIPGCLFKQHSNGLKPGEVICSDCGNWQHYACVGFEVQNTELSSPENHAYYCMDCNPVSHQDYINIHTNSLSFTDGLQHKIDTAILEIKDLERKLFQKEIDIEECKAQAMRIEDISRHHKSVQTRIDHIFQGSDSYQSFETLLQEREEHIKSLEKKLSDRRSLGRFTKLSNDCRDAFGQGMESYEGFSEVFETAKQFALQVELPMQSISPNLDQHPDLKMLASAGLRFEEDEVEPFASLNKLNTQQLLRFLTTSGLLLWVFNTDFPQLASGKDLVLMTYRECLLQQDGPTTVSNLDLACYHSVIRGRHFHQTYIKPEAEKLVIRFSQALAPLFSATPNSSRESNWDNFSTWSEDSEKWVYRRSRLFELFQQSLRLKAELCLNTEAYEMKIYEPGTKYDENTMNVETEEGMSFWGGQHGEDVVKICVEAGFFSFAKTESLNRLSLGPTMRSSNFVQRNGEQRFASQVLIKAVVVLEKY